MKRTIRLLMLVSAVMFIASTAFSATYEHEVKAKDMTFAWTVDGDTLHAKMAAPTKGWVAVGFNPSKEMKDANIVMGYVKNGKAQVADHFGNRATGHAEDTKLGGTDDVVLVGGSEANGVTTIEFTMPMASKDKQDQVLKKDGDTILMMAYGPDRDSFRPRHTFRTVMTVNLASGASR